MLPIDMALGFVTAQYLIIGLAYSFELLYLNSRERLRRTSEVLMHRKGNPCLSDVFVHLGAPGTVGQPVEGQVLSHIHAQELDRQLDRITKGLPDWAGRLLRWLREPSSRWFRIPAGVLLILCGFVGFLPVLGFWMVPLGLILLSQDIPFLRRPTYRALLWLEEKWDQWKSRKG